VRTHPAPEGGGDVTTAYGGEADSVHAAVALAEP
jgi:hypothetical protein